MDLVSLEPGVHELHARVGEHEVPPQVRVHAGSMSVVCVLFDRDPFPENPTPPRCFAEGSPEDVAGRGTP